MSVQIKLSVRYINMEHCYATECTDSHSKAGKLISALLEAGLPRDTTQSAVLLRQVVCLSVTFRYRDHAHRLDIVKIISRSVSLGCSALCRPNITDLLQREHPKILTQSDTPLLN